MVTSRTALQMGAAALMAGFVALWFQVAMAGQSTVNKLSGRAPVGQASYDALWALLQLDELAQIVTAEGRSRALAADIDLLGRPGGKVWQRKVDFIYNKERMRAEARTAMQAALAPRHLRALLEFYSDQEIQQVVAREMSVRRMFLDARVEEKARRDWLDRRGLPNHSAEISHFVEVNDLVERNVTGTLNSNYAFLRALAEAHPVVSERLTEDEILSQLWSQEGEIRRDASEWIYAFLTTAYDPISEKILGRYISFCDTQAGRALNHAMFDAFETVYRRLSTDLGHAVAQIGSARAL